MKVRIPLEPRTSAGEPCPTPVVKLRVRDKYGTFAELDFRIDTQADVSTIPARRAEREGIAFSREREGTVRGIAGTVKKYRGRIRVVLAGKEHDWPCDFTEPALDPVTGRPLPDLSPILGRAGFLREYAIAVDGDYLILTRVGPFRRWLRERLHGFWEVFRMVHPVDRPL